MAANSSTSSSDAAPHGPKPQPRMGFPWALAVALLIVAGVEVYLHTFPKMKLIAYASDEGQYHAVRDTVDAVGPAEVALIGSSQMREGVTMPMLIAETEKRLGRPVRISNYAVRGARLDGFDAIVGYLQRQPNPPKLIIVGVSQRDLRADDIDWPRVALFWNWPEWGRQYDRHGFEATDVLPVMLRNEAGKLLYTLRYREEIALTLRRPLERFGVDASEEGNPILGETTFQHLGSRGMRTLVGKTKRDYRTMFRMAQGTYQFDLPAKPRPAMRRCLDDLVTHLSNGPAKGLLVQMPNADYLQNELTSKGQTKAFLNAVQRAAGGKVPFVPLDAFPFKPSDETFVDLQHLNRPGAEAMSRFLAGEIAHRLAAGQP